MCALSPESDRPRVLIADAAPLTRWALERAFACEGYDTCTAAGCEELLEQLTQHRNSLIVSASRFGNEDATPMLRQLARARPDLRVIVLGAPDDPEIEARHSPNFVTVEQPFSVADLLRIAGAATSPVAPLECNAK